MECVGHVPASRRFSPAASLSHHHSALSAAPVPPERQRHFMFDLGAANADVAQQPVVELAQLAALARTLVPAEESIEETGDKAMASPAARGTHEV